LIAKVNNIYFVIVVAVVVVTDVVEAV